MERIVIDQRIKRGKPVVAGTRVPVEIVVGSLAGGMSYDEVAVEYGLTREDILACLDYAAHIMSSESTYMLPTAGSD